MKELFLDANAHVPLNSKAAQSYLDFHQSPAGHGHPSSPNQPGRYAAGELEKARSKIASLIGAKKPSQIIFTSGCTSAAEWGLETFFDCSGGQVFSSELEHPAVREVFETLSEHEFDNSYYLQTTSDGLVDLESPEFLDEELTQAKIVCHHLQNEIGTVQPLDKIKRGLLFCDASQSLGKIPFNVSELNIDIACFSSHKFGGPGGFGFLYLRDTSWWTPHGAGSRYFLDRTGSPDTAGAVATAVALEEAVSTLEARTQIMGGFQSTLEAGLEKFGFEIIGKKAPRSTNTTFVRLGDGKGLTSLFSLGENGIHCGLGSACGAMNTGKSNTIKVLGLEGKSHDFLRISQFGEYNENDARYFLTKLDKILSKDGK